MTRLLRGALLIVAVTAALSPSRAGAQRGVDQQTFHPALDSYGIFTVERAQTSHQWDFGFKAFINYAANPLVLAMFDEATMRPRRQAVIDHLVAINLGMHLGLTRWLQLAIDIPISAQSYTTAYGNYGAASETTLGRSGFYATGPITNVPPPNAAPNDVKLALKARLFRKGVFGMALMAILTVPFGDDQAFLGDTSFTFRPKLIADITRGPVTFAFNLGAVVREQTTILDPHEVSLKIARPRVLLDVGHELTWSVGIAYRFVQWVGIAAEAFGGVPLTMARADAPRDTTADVIGGLQIFPSKDLVLGFGAGAGVAPDSSRHDQYRVFIGMTWAPTEGQKGAISAAGIDTDSDGVSDSQDMCPGEAEDRDGFQDEDGCPDYDNDGDGFVDRQDRCPNDSEDKDGFQDDDGCPELDNDNDGIPDAQDKCPSDVEDRDGFQDDDGCPDADNDGDGIADAGDRCPNEPETRNGVDDEDGCPDSGGAATPGARVEIAEKIGFDANQVALSKANEALLDKVAERLRNNPQARRVRIEGHTDDLGGPAKQKKDAQARAEAVREYLIKKGVEPERLQAVGYGYDRPVDKGKTLKARAANRRVEFIVVEQ